MAITNYKFFLFSAGKAVAESKLMEVLFKSLSVTSDGTSNGYDITQGASGFSFNSKKLTGVTGGAASGEVLTYDQRGAASGLASLDSGGKVPATQLPNTVMEFKGAWDPSANTPTLEDGTGNAGDVYRASGTGTQTFGGVEKTWHVGDLIIYNGSVWQFSPASDGVSSVNGKGGAVVLVTDDITEGSVNKYWAQGLFNTAFSGKTTDGLTEGTVNKYYSTSLFNSDFGGKTTDNLTEGTVNKYYSSSLFNSDFGGKTTDNLTEGTTNKYFSGKTTDDLAEGTVNKYFTGSNTFASFTNKHTGAMAARDFVKMTVDGQVTMLTSADSVTDETFFGCVKTGGDADATVSAYIPEVGARVGGFTALDVTKWVYAHASTPGGYTQTRPTTGKVIVLGRPISGTEIVFLGYLDFVYA